MTAARVPQVMGIKRQLPFSQTLERIHPKLQTPANALIFESLLAVIYIFSGTFNTLTDLLIFVLWIFFTMGVFGVFMLRKKFLQKKEITGFRFIPSHLFWELWVGFISLSVQ